MADRLRSSRSRHRRDQDEVAHDDGPAPAERKRLRKVLAEHPLVPTQPAALLEKATDVTALAERLKAAGSFAFDSEFIGESNYRPRLCLVQVATTEEIALIDSLAVTDLTPIWQLIADPDVEVLVHAGDQDLEPASRLNGGAMPRNVLDTQVSAAFCGLPYPTSLAKLVEYVTQLVLDRPGMKLGKGLTFTQWDRRPLSAKQLSYAADDVRYLPLIGDWLRSTLAERGHIADWCREENDARATAAATTRSRLEAEPWNRVKGYPGLYGSARPILRELAKWRETSASTHDLPPRALLKDEVLIYLAKHPPKPQPDLITKLAEVRHLPRPVAERHAKEILAAVTRGREADAEERARHPEPVEPTLADRSRSDAAFSLARALSVAAGVEPDLTLARRDVDTLLRHHDAADGKASDDEPSLLRGWRRQAVGDDLVRLLRDETVSLRLG